MTEFDPQRFAQLCETKRKVGDKAPPKLNAELAELAAAQQDYTPPLEEIAKAQVLQEREFSAHKIKAAQELDAAIEATEGKNEDPDTILTAIESLR